MLIKKIPLVFIATFFILTTKTSVAQEDTNKTNQLNFSAGDTLSFVESLPQEVEEDVEEIDENAGDGQSLMYIYFKWMPGYGVYTDFDIMKVHYKHTQTINPDTIVLGDYVPPTKYKPVLGKGMYGVIRRGGRRHWGIDISYPEGTPVVAAFDGIVRVSTYNTGGYGNMVIIRHHNGLETYYAHFLRRLVNPGQMVKAGDTIGLGGNTGRSRGNHLHFETRYLGQHFDPARIIDFQNLKLKCDTLFVGGKVLKTNTDKPNTTTGYGEPADSTPVYIIVRRGDTLGALAKKHRTTVATLKRINNMKSDFLREGQRLRIR